jgi:hypothetical protein
MRSGKKEARKAMLKELSKEMRKERHKDNGIDDMLGGLKKVTVAAPTEEGLIEGLKMASEKAPKMMSAAEKIMKARDEFGCGGAKEKKYKDGGTKEEDKFELDEDVKESMKSLMKKTDALTDEELKEKITKLKRK